MSHFETLLQVVSRLNRLQIPYMLSGAFAASYYGMPRSTHDIDLIAEVDLPDIERIHQAYQEDFYAGREDMEEAFRHGSMFNLIHNETMTKVGFWILEDTAFDRERFSRRSLEDLEGTPVYISTVEDLMVIKLEWFQKTGAHKHYEDALGIVQVQRDALDIPYVRARCERQSTAELLDRLLGEAG